MAKYDDVLRGLDPDGFRKQYEGRWEPPGPLSEAELARMERRYRDHTDAYRLTMEVRRQQTEIARLKAIETAARAWRAHIEVCADWYGHGECDDACNLWDALDNALRAEGTP